MTTAEKPRDPKQQMGVFTQLADVPDRYRLRQYAQSYAGRRVWDEFVTAQRENHGASEWYCETARKAGRYWKEHMDSRGRHHALATPADAERWCADLLETRKKTTVYGEYWVKVLRFYSWLQYHTEHPHAYHPILMAAAEYPKTRELWDFKIDRSRTTSSE